MSMSTRWFTISSLVVGAALAAGCSLSSAMSGDEPPAAKNECGADADCDPGRCADGLCVATAGEIDTLLFEVTPPAGTTSSTGASIAGVRFTKVLDDVQAAQGRFDLRLGFVSRLKGSIHATPPASKPCVVAPRGEQPAPASEDGSLPARLTLVPRERLLGLPNPVQTAEARLVGTSYTFDIAVPPGKYDVYVEPLAASDGCALSPYLVVAQDLPAEDVDLTVTLPEPESLTVKILWPFSSDDLSGWTIDIVESQAGRRLSNQVVLRDPAPGPDGLQYLAALAFSGLSLDENVQAAEIVRLSPPAGMVAPTVYIQRSVVELFQGGQGLIDQLKQLPRAVRLMGQVNRQGRLAPIAATVTVVATSLAAVSPGTVASFSRTVTTSPGGAFEVDVLPGEYRVVVEATEPGWAATEQRLTVSDASDSQLGWVFEVPPQALMEGNLVDFRGRPAPGVLIQALVPPSGMTSDGVLEAARGSSVFPPRAPGDYTGETGRFVLLADPGLFNLTAQAEEASGFAWGVRLGVEIGRQDINVGGVKLNLPQVLAGELSSDDVGLVPSALIRAYAYVKNGRLTSNPAEATNVVPVAESRVSVNGTYRLLLPSSFE